MNRRKDLKSIIFLFAILWSLQQIFAQQLPKVSAMIDTTDVRIGEQIRLDIQAKTDTLSFVDFPEQENFGDLEVVEHKTADTLSKKPLRLLKKTYFLTQWDSGHYVIPQIPVKINDSVFLTDSLQVHFREVVVDTTKQQLYEYKDIVNVNKISGGILNTKISYWWLLLLLLLIPLAYFLYHRRKKHLENQKTIHIYEKTLDELARLNQEKLWLRNQVDKHYLRLTDILKDYIEKELKLPAKELLSFQIVEKLKKYQFENEKYIDKELLNRLQQMLQRADLAKFAKLEPEIPDIDLDFNLAKEFIDYTHKIIKGIEDAKAEEIAQALAEKKARKKQTYIILGVVFGLLLAILGTGYYYLSKKDFFNTLKENIKAPEWVYNEYGGKPSLGLVTPHVLNSYDMSEAIESTGNNADKLKRILDEFTLYVDENLIKGYVIFEFNMDYKEDFQLQEGFERQFMQGALGFLEKTGKVKNIQITTEEKLENGTKYAGTLDVKIPVLNKTKAFAFTGKILYSGNHARMVFGAYAENNKENKDLAERVLQSAELKN